MLIKTFEVQTLSDDGSWQYDHDRFHHSLEGAKRLVSEFEAFGWSARIIPSTLYPKRKHT